MLANFDTVEQPNLHIVQKSFLYIEYG